MGGEIFSSRVFVDIKQVITRFLRASITCLKVKGLSFEKETKLDLQLLEVGGYKVCSFWTQEGIKFAASGGRRV